MIALGLLLLPWQASAVVEYTALDIGGASGGTTVAVTGGFDVTANGRDIGGASDQFHFGYQERIGNFDLRVRVAGLTVSVPFVQAGLTARDSLDPGGRFAGIFTSSAQLGCFFESRASQSAQSQTAAPSGGFPANYPHTWLRLRRSGDQFTGYASFDGLAWQELGTTTFALPTNVFFGMALASHSTNAVATARFRELGPVANPSTFTYTAAREPLGPSSRRTGLVFSEIMYHPPDRSDEKNLEFIELYNAESIFVDLTGWRLAGAVKYSFPDGLKIQAGEFLVVAADRAAVETAHGIRAVLGPYAGRLNNASETLRLLNPAGAVRLEVQYSPNPPWPVAADGAGHSLVLARPSFGESDPQAWSASDQIGGSPGEVDAISPNPWRGVVINEFLAHTDDPMPDFIELHNATGRTLDLSDCFLSDSSLTNKFRIPKGTTLPARGFISFNQQQLGFALDSGGETIYLLAADQSRIIDSVRFTGQENGISSGRSPDGAPVIRRLSATTPGAANPRWRVEDVVINEIMYQPVSKQDADEYVELHNRSASAVSLAGWRFTAGIDFEFPAGASIPAGGYVVVASDADRLRAKQPHLNAANSFGGFQGSLRDGGERVALGKPDQVLSTNRLSLLVTNTIYIDVSEVTYIDGGRWPDLADGGGSSLELIDPRADLLRPSNWAASDEAQKAPWTSFEFTGPLNLGTGTPAANRFQILMLGPGECLVDDVEIFRVGSTNLLANGGFESGATGWTFFGHHSRSTIDSSGAASGSNCLHVRAPGDGDTGNNAIRANLTSTMASGQTATIRAKVRWLSGWPEVLFRVRGNWIEFPVRMELPKNLGTPGLPNSRRVSNAGPAIFDVSHSPALPRVNEAVVVTCRVSDPDNVAPPRLRFRVDPSATLSNTSMNDEGLGADAVAGDGIYSGTISGRAANTRVAFRIEASDDSSPAATTIFPADAPQRECLIRWGETIPFGTFAHYHLWNTDATEQARNAARPLNNTFRDGTLVYGNFRIIYNAGFRDKGSPYHGGSGDFTVTVPDDDLLLGATDRVFGSTGNGGNESTGMRGDISAWIGAQMGIPYLHNHYIRLYRNGTRFREVLYDMEQPNRDYARSWFGGDTSTDDLYKIAVWFEFQDDNSTFQATGATIERFLSGNTYKLGRYRWNWQQRPGTDTANNYASIFNLVTAANSGSDRVNRLLTAADMEQWMRVFAFNRVVGNWDAWTFNVGQNMYIYFPTGERASLMPWDIDFVLGDGNGTTDALWGGQDPIANQLYALPAFRRMLWRAYQDASKGPMRPENYNPQIDARRAVLLKNGVTGLVDPRPLKTYLDGRRTHLIRQLQLADTPNFTITSNAGRDFTTGNVVSTLAGSAPFAVAAIEINGVPYPINWTGFTNWQISVPLGAATNVLNLVGRDLRGQTVPGATATVTIRYTGEVPQPQDWVGINEIMYHPPVQDAEFVELFNRHPSVTFDLSGFRFSGLGFVFSPGTFIAPNGYLVLAKDRAAFANAYGATIPVAGEFSGSFDKGGETLRLLKPGATEAEDITIDDVRYEDDSPWPAAADGLGSSLQLIDPAQDSWRVGNWTVISTNSPDRATPGRANASRNFLDPFPLLWINEVLPSNRTGALDNQSEREPWIELYNAGGSSIDLSGFFLSNDSNDLSKWRFPAGTALGAGQYLLLWADGETGESTAAALHTSFRLDATNGLVTLSRLQLGVPAVMDYVNYTIASADQAFGSYPNGEPRKRRLLYVPTLNGPNNPNVPTLPVFINEWMASNRSTIIDPADRDLDDWFEIYNAGTTNVNLSGFYLTSDLADRTQFVIPSGTIIPARGFRLFWADDELGQNLAGRDIHTNFRLPAEGGQIGLYAPDGALVDSVSFAQQTADMSEGRLPDGIEPPFVSFAVATPGQANNAQTANRPPTIAAIEDKTVNEGQALAFRIQASDSDAGQSLLFSLAAAPLGAAINSTTGGFTWTPAEAQGPGAFQATVRVSDNGTPARSSLRTFSITVNEVNVSPSLDPITNVTADEGTLFSFRPIANDSDVPAQKLAFTLDPGAPTGATIDSASGEFSWLPAEEQGPGTYTVTLRVTDEGTPALSTTRAFIVTVREINNPPVVAAVSPQSVDEGTTLTLQIEARDSDNPPAKLTYTLESAPPAASINPDTGLFAWTPGEAEGPRDYNITVQVSEPGGSPSSMISFLVGVREVNAIPVLAPIPDFAVNERALLTFTNRASDIDLPPQTLAFSATTALPNGAQLDPASGIFSWLVPEDAPRGTNFFIIRVTDDATPPRSAEQSFRVVVNAPLRIAISEIQHRPATANAEYVEIANYSMTTAVNLSGWRLEGYHFVFPSGTVIDPNSFLCVAKNLSVFRTAYGVKPAALGDASVLLGADGGLLRLLKPGTGAMPDEVIDEVNFSLLAPWPSGTTRGASLQVIDLNEDNRRAGNWAASDAAGAVTNAPVNVLSMEAAWKFWQNATSPGAAWNTVAFNDNAWVTGPGLFYVETAALPFPKRTALTLGSTTYYFRSHFNFSGDPKGALLKLQMVIDDGAVYYLNGQEFFRSGLPNGPIAQTTFATRTVSDAVVEGIFDAPAASLRTGDNVVAVEVHQVNATSSDIVFGAQLDLVTMSAVAFTPGSPNSVAANLPSFPPMIDARLEGDGKFRLTWNTKLGVRYRLQTTTNLINPAWQTIFETVADQFQQSFLAEAPVIDPQRYYRVLEN